MKHTNISKKLVSGFIAVALISAPAMPVLAASSAEAAVTTAALAAADGEMEDVAESDSVVGMPNPFQEFSTLAEAEKCAGFELGIPLIAPDGYKDPVYRAIPGEFLEVVWTNDEGEDFRYRKCPDSYGDASGDYNNYGVNRTIHMGGVAVSIRGDEDIVIQEHPLFAGIRVHVVSDTGDEGYSNAMTSSAGLSTAQIEKLRVSLLDEWLPSALQGATAEEARGLMNCFGTQMYDTGISLIYNDDENPGFFFYIPLDDQRRVVNVIYMENGTVELN